MALKGKPISLTNVATTVFTCPAGVEASVHGLIFSNNTGGTLSVNVLVFNQADATTVTVATGLIVPANQFITWTKPINLAAGDSIQATSSAATGMVCLFSVFEGSAAPVAIGFTGRGEWSNVSTFAVNDIVSVTGEGTFLALAESIDQDPTSNTAAWMFLEGISASALPPQAGQEGKFLTTDGTDASFAEVDVSGGAEIVDPMSSNITLTSASKRVQVLIPDGPNRTISLPVAGTLTLGESFIILNKSNFTVRVNNDSGGVLTFVAPAQAVKFLLADTATTDWEAYNIGLLGELQSLASVLASGPNHIGAQFGTIVSKYDTNQYQAAFGINIPQNREASLFFSVDDDDVITTITHQVIGTYGGNVQGGGRGGNLNGRTFIDDHIYMFGGSRRVSSASEMGVFLYESSLQAGMTERHFSLGGAFTRETPVAKLGTRRGIMVFSKSDALDDNLSYIFRVIDYSSSLTAPTVGTNVLFNSGGTHNPTISDLDTLETNKVIFAFNSRFGTTGNQFRKRAAVCTVSGTTPTIHTSIEIEGTEVPDSQLGVRVLSPQKAIVAWAEGSKSVAKVVNISGNTLTAGAKFDLLGAPFEPSSIQITPSPSGDNEFFIFANNNSDNSTVYMSKITISGTTFVSSTAFSKVSQLIGSINRGGIGSIYDSVRDNFITVFPGTSRPALTAITETNM